jgi:hypothetical protein
LIDENAAGCFGRRHTVSYKTSARTEYLDRIAKSRNLAPAIAGVIKPKLAVNADTLCASPVAKKSNVKNRRG